MGILNITPDSFSDGGRFACTEDAVARGLQLIEEGADILDIGGESTRPGARTVSAEEEIDRVLPVLEALRRHTRTVISIDTYKAVVARRAIMAGVDLVNDISGFRFDEGLPEVVRQGGVAVVLTHIRGTPQTMSQQPPSPDIMREIQSGLGESLRRAYEAGIAPERVLLDPGIGFGKNAQENLIVLSRLERLAALGRPLLVGASRKSFIGAVTNKPAGERVLGSVAAAAAAVLHGAHIVRVHDVQPTVEAIRVLDAIAAERVAP